MKKKDDAFKLALNLVTESMTAHHLCWHFIEALQSYPARNDDDWHKLLTAADPDYGQYEKKHDDLHREWKALKETHEDRERDTFFSEECENWCAMSVAWATAGFAMGVALAMRFKGGAIIPALSVIEGGKKEEPDTLKGECKL